MLELPVSAAGDKALGVVTQSEVAHLGDSNLTVGTSVFAGDLLSTDPGGNLRLRVGAGQVYLLASSVSTLTREEGAIRANVNRGTVGFSTNAAEKLEVLIPQGILRAADDQPVHGQVTITGPTDAIVSSYHGTLVLDNGGELHTIAEGTSYRVVIAPDDAGDSQEPPVQYPESRRRRRRKLLFALILLGGMAGIAIALNNEITESPSHFK
jgi:hypothetical protein